MELRVEGPAGAVLEEDGEQGAPDDFLAVGPDPRKPRLVLQVAQRLLHRRELGVLDFPPQFRVGEGKYHGRRLGHGEGAVVARIAGFSPGVPHELVLFVLVVEPRTEPPDVLVLGGAREAELLGGGAGPDGQRLPPEFVVADGGKLQVIGRSLFESRDAEH